jgi:hypothetical protein
MTTRLPLSSLIALLLLVAPTAHADSETDRRLAALEATIAALQSEVRSLRSEAAEREQAVEVLTDELERGRLDGATEAPETFEGAVPAGVAPAAGKVYERNKGVSIGGYGEMLFESFSSELDDGSPSSKKDQADFLRGIVYLGYKFSDHIVFNSEIEFEHASTGKKGSASVEQAYLDFLIRDEVNVRAGMLLTPVGFVNELHEPPTFLGARRPRVEQVIIPTTWRENGVGLHGAFGPVSYRANLTAGLDAAGFSDSSGLRGGRQKGSKSLAEDGALSFRLDYEPIEGLLFGASGYFGESGQGVDLGAEILDVSTELWSAHAEWRWRGLQTRALWARVELDDVSDLNDYLGLTGMDSIGSRMEGWYGEVGYDVLAHRDTRQELIPFIRYEDFDTQARVPDGFLRDPAHDRNSWTLGLSYKPHPNVVIKFDWHDEDNAAGTGQDQFNLALGYMF